MKTKLLLATVFLFYINSGIRAQSTAPPVLEKTNCRTEVTQVAIEMEAKRDQNAYRQLLQEQAQSIRAAITEYTVQIHIVRKDDGTGGIDVATVRDEIANWVNPYFAEVNAKFVECSAERYINSTAYYSLSGDAEGDAMSVANNVANVINIYFVDDPDEACGWARFPWMLPSDYIVIANSCASNQSTLVHELGHYFSLYHTHETAFGAENVTRSGADACYDCDTDGDKLCDTPADPTLNLDTVSITPAPACVYSSALTDSCGVSYTPDPTSIMSYSLKECRTIFTASQKAKMMLTMASAPGQPLYGRNYLQTSCPCVITTPASNITVECDGGGNEAAYANWLSTHGGATASCDGTWSNNGTGLSDGCGATGSETVTFTLTDPSGNQASTVATFTIQDLTAPLVVCPEDIHLPECVETASWLATGSDACGSVTIVSDPPSGSVFEKGTAAVVKATATDECGNKSTCSFTVSRDPDLAVAIDPPATSPLNTCALGIGANIVLGYGGGPSCIILHAVGSGGHAPYTYSWTAPAEVPAANFVNINTDSPTFCAGFQSIPCASYNFVVTVTDIHGCTETNEVTVKVINPLCTTNNNAKVNVCHRPPNNVSNENTLCTSANAIPAHLAVHPDCLGECNATCVPYSAQREKTFTSLQDKVEPYSIAAYPNPINSRATIQISAKYNTKAQLAVVDLTGRVLVVLFEGMMLENTPYLIDFDASKMQSGFYMVKLIGADGVFKYATIVVAN